MERKYLEKQFELNFGTTEYETFFAPGRVNLIGEHIDYNGGKVFPCAINLGTFAVVKKRSDRRLRFLSLNFESVGIVESSLDTLEYKEADMWANYAKGVLHSFEAVGCTLDVGFDIMYYGNIPNGSGLSSSASIEVLTAWIITSLYNFDKSRIECALLVQKTENEYMGVNTGIMDQFAISMGKKDYAILLDTSNLEFNYVPFSFEDAKLIIMNTNKRRELVDSKYNIRRSECDQALEIVKKHYDVSALCDISLSQLEQIEGFFNNEIVYRRARHAVSENERTNRAMTVLSNHDAVGFGALMNASHYSLKNDYEVTGLELDTLVSAAQSLHTTYGARVTGAGFGGCAIALIHKDSVQNFEEHVRQEYLSVVGYEPSFYSVEIEDGVRKLV